MSGTLGGVDASIPLRAGVGTGQVANQLANNPLAFIDAMTRLKTLQLLPGQLQLQQQELQSGQQNIAANAIALGQKQAASAANYLRTLFGQPSVSHDDVVRALGAAHGVPGVNTDALVGRLAEYNPGPGGNYAGFVRDQLLPTMSESGAMQALTPTLTTINTGGGVQVGQTLPLASGYPGQFRPQGTLPVTMTPAEKTQTQPTVIPTAQGPQPADIPKGAIYSQTGDFTGNPLLTGPMAGQALTGPIIPTGTPQGTAEAAATRATSSAAKFQDIVSQGVNARQQAGFLGTMQAEASRFTPGMGADTIKAFKSALVRAKIPGIDADSLAAQESVDKIANQLADALGAGSDARMHVQQGANPSSHNTPAGLDLIIRQLLGNTDYLQARQQLAATFPDKRDIEGFEAKVGSNLDPRVFQYNRLMPEQKGEYFNGIPKDDRARFKAGWAWAKDAGLVGQ